MSRLRDRVPPVTPLPEERWGRIERRILVGMRETPAPRRVLRWLAPAVAVAAVAGMALAVYLNVRGAGQGGGGIASGAPTRVVAGAAGSRVDIGDAVLELAPDTALEIRRSTAGGVTVELDGGAVELDVVPRGGKPALLVQAGDVVVTVVGTRFRVERGDEIRVTVSHGVVQVARGGAMRRVAAGQGWSGPADAVAAGREAMGEVVAVAGDGERGRPGPGTGTGTGTGMGGDPEVIAAKEPALVNDGRTPALGEHVNSAPPVADSTAGSGERRRPDRGSTASEEPDAGVVRAATPAGEIAAQPLAGVLALETTDADEAVRQYTAIVAEKDSRRAAHALYSRAHVQYFRLRQSSEAMRSLTAYERRFPRGAEAESVLWLRIRILCSTRIDDACRAAAHSFLDRFPSSGERARIADRIVDIF